MGLLLASYKWCLQRNIWSGLSKQASATLYSDIILEFRWERVILSYILIIPIRQVDSWLVPSFSLYSSQQSALHGGRPSPSFRQLFSNITHLVTVVVLHPHSTTRKRNHIVYLRFVNSTSRLGWHGTIG